MYTSGTNLCRLKKSKNREIEKSKKSKKSKKYQKYQKYRTLFFDYKLGINFDLLVSWYKLVFTSGTNLRQHNFVPD